MIIPKKPGNIPITRLTFMKRSLPLNLNLDKAYAVPRTNKVEIKQERIATIRVFKNHLVNIPS